MKPIVCLYTLGSIFDANMDNTNNHPLICDPIEGVCGLPQEQISAAHDSVLTNKPIKVIYFTDPICSSCWGIEPQLRKLKLEYGHYLEIEYRMGGLLPDWSYNSGGISKPADVALHWDEVSLHYDMPIDGDVWLVDPLDSSYPPSIAFKAALAQDNDKAILFLRAIREMVFLQKKNITRWEYLQEAANAAGLDSAKLKTDYYGPAKVWFEEDLAIARQYGVRGFPTMFFTNEKGERQMVYGTKSYEFYENAVRTLVPEAEKHSYPADWENLFKKYTSLTAKEFSFLAKLDRRDGEQQLRALSDKGLLIRVDTKNGSVWFGR